MQFLQSVAQAYIDNEVDNLVDYCFVFPNKRSITFFSHAFGKIVSERRIVAMEPSYTTISDFIASFTDSVEAERMELIFILYNAYQKVVERASGKSSADTIDFNRFQYWADVLINDFSDVDRYLVDARQIFRNVENLKEISANYLTDEQIAAIRKYWDDENVPAPVKDFWNHIAHDTSGKKKNLATTGFVKLWQAMYEIYVEFRRMLKEAGLCYGGMQYREALDRLKSMWPEDLPYGRYVFVGFNMLSKSERKIFEVLKDKSHDDGSPLADFYWDNASPAFRMEGNAAGALINRYAKSFPSIYQCVDQITEWPEIEIIGVPSRMAQAKLVGEIVDDILPGEHPSQIEMRRTAIVLPQESLSVPVLHSLAPRVSPVNITMGFPLRETSVAALLRNIVSMQLRARSVQHANMFYYEDVVSVLSNPLLRNVAPKVCFAALRQISLNRLYNIPESFFRTPELEVFATVFEMTPNRNDAEAVLSYLERLLNWIREKLVKEVEPSDPDDPDEDSDTPRRLDETLIECYFDAIATLRHLSKKYLAGRNVFMGDATVFHLVERMVSGAKVNFEGMPLKGLQVMGVLEARSLDFENLILPSMNERIFPRKHFSKSFIPNALRVAYEMSTTEHQELIYAYYFYRMISRAKRVWLLYDARTSGTMSGDMSRYLYQLIYAYRPAGLKQEVKSFNLHGEEDRQFGVPKTPEVMEKLEAFRSKKNPRHLSAHSINQYIDCPLQFYFSYIKGYYEESEKFRYIDEGTYGTIVHDVVQWLYEERKAAGEDSVLITCDVIDSMLKETVNIDRLIRRSINKNYRDLGDKDDSPLSGDTLIIGRVIKKYVMRMLQCEKSRAPFRFVNGELEEKGFVVLDDGSPEGPVQFNLTARIDRVDQLESPLKGHENLLRIVDYKTGSDSVTSARIDDLFVPNSMGKRHKAMLQLLLYCNAYGQFQKTDRPIQPLIYSFRQIISGKLDPIKIAKNEILDYHDVNEEFLSRICNVIREIFSPDVPFTNPPDNHACTYCKFTELCEKRPR